YTSGTTGRPKGCILTNFYYLTAGAWYRDLGGLVTIERGRERILNPLPLFHMNNQAVTATCAILTANCLILPERFSPGRGWADGRPQGDLEARVVDAEDREVPRGVEGELVVRCAGPDPRRGFFAGYLKDPAATEEAWQSGWFHTGDVVRQTPDGMLVFVDRKKNIIRRAGENIAAAEVEAA